MVKVVLIDGLRTPIGKHGGVFCSLTAQHLMAQVFSALLDRVGLDPKLVAKLYANAAKVETLQALLVAMERKLESIDAALRAIDKGQYGICERCGETIDPARLEARSPVPRAGPGYWGRGSPSGSWR